MVLEVEQERSLPNPISRRLIPSQPVSCASRNKPRCATERAAGWEGAPSPGKGSFVPREGGAKLFGVSFFPKTAKSLVYLYKICLKAKASCSGQRSRSWVCSRALMRPGSFRVAVSPSRAWGEHASRACCLCSPARASFLFKIRPFRGKFLLPALHAHILHMQAIRHTSALHADKGVRVPAGKGSVRRLRGSPRATVGLQNSSPDSSTPAHHL